MNAITSRTTGNAHSGARTIRGSLASSVAMTRTACSPSTTASAARPGARTAFCDFSGPDVATTYPYLARTRTRCTWGPLLVLLLSFTLKLSANEVSMNGAFSSEQAELGSHLFSANCSQCHTGIQVA